MNTDYMTTCTYCGVEYLKGEDETGLCEEHRSNKYWAINVRGWGTLYAIGTEEQAEEWRRHKANWEQAVATKKQIKNTDAEKWDLLTNLLAN